MSTEVEFRKNHREWCKDCQSGPKPDDHCDGCKINHIKSARDGTVLAAPTGYRLTENPTE